MSNQGLGSGALRFSRATGWEMFTPDGFRALTGSDEVWGFFGERVRSLATIFLAPNPIRAGETVGFAHANLAAANGVFDTHSGPYGLRIPAGSLTPDFWNGPGRYDRWNAQFLNHGFGGAIGVGAIGASTMLVLFTRDNLGVVPVGLNLASGDWRYWSGTGWRESPSSSVPLPNTSNAVPQLIASIPGTDDYLVGVRWGAEARYSLLRLVTGAGVPRWESLTSDLSTWRALEAGVPADLSIDIRGSFVAGTELFLFGNIFSRDEEGEPIWTAVVLRYDSATSTVAVSHTLPGEEMVLAAADGNSRYVVTRKRSDGPTFLEQVFYLRGAGTDRFGQAARLVTAGTMETIGKPAVHLSGLTIIDNTPVIFIGQRSDGRASIRAVGYGASPQLLGGALPPGGSPERFLSPSLGTALTEFDSQVRLEVFDPDPYPSGLANRIVSFLSPYGRQPCTQMMFLPDDRLLCSKGITTGIALLDPISGGEQHQWGAMWDLNWFPFAAALDPVGGRVFVAEEATMGGTGSQQAHGLLSVWDWEKRNESLAWRTDASFGTFMRRENCYAPERIRDLDPARSEEQRLNYPSGMMFDATTRILSVAEAAGHRIRRFEITASAPTRVIRELSPFGVGELSCPMGLARDREGNMLVANMCAHTITRISPSGEILQTIGAAGSGPGELYYPAAVVEDPRAGNLYVSDTGNKRLVVYGANGVVIDSFNTLSLPGGETRQLRSPGALAINQDGVLVVDDHTFKYLIGLQ